MSLCCCFKRKHEQLELENNVRKMSETVEPTDSRQDCYVNKVFMSEDYKLDKTRTGDSHLDVIGEVKDFLTENLNQEIVERISISVVNLNFPDCKDQPGQIVELLIILHFSKKKILLKTQYQLKNFKSNQENEPKLITNSQPEMNLAKPVAPPPPTPPPPPPPPPPPFPAQGFSEKHSPSVQPSLSTNSSSNSLFEQQRNLKPSNKHEETKSPLVAAAGAMDFLTEIRMKFGKKNLDTSTADAVDNDIGKNIVNLFQVKRFDL
jgi:hypothetical protein